VKLQDEFLSWTVLPAGVVNAGHRQRLNANLWVGPVAIVKQGQENPHAMMVSDAEKVVNPLSKSTRVVAPNQIMQIDPQSVESETLSPTEFSVDCFSVIGVRLPHFQLVDRGAW